MPPLNNLDKFWEMLKTANITDVKFVHGDGVVISDTDTEIQTRPDIAAIIAAYDPAPSTNQLALIARKANALITARSIPNYALWTQSEWITYFNANLSDTETDKVTSLATARVMMKRQNQVIQNLTKLVLALRDETWPNLPNE